MPPPQPSPAPVGAGAGADVDSIRRSWAQQASLDLATEQEFPHMIINTQPASSNNHQSSSLNQTPSCSRSHNIQSRHHSMSRAQLPSSVPSYYSPNILKYGCPSDNTTSRSSSPQPLLSKIPSNSISSSTKSNCTNSMRGSHQRRYPNNDSSQAQTDTSSLFTRSSPVQHQIIKKPIGRKPKYSKEILECTPVNKNHTVETYIPRCLVSTHQALASTEFCPVMTKVMLAKAWNNNGDNLDRLMRRLDNKMEAIRQRQEKGLVHYRQGPIVWYDLLSRSKKNSTRRDNMEKGVECANEPYLLDNYHEPENEDEGKTVVQLGGEDSDDEDLYRKIRRGDKSGPYLKSSPPDRNFNIFSALSNVTQNVRNILQSNNITITSVKAYEVTTEKTKESNNSDGIVKDEAEVEEVGTCPICGQVMLMKVLPHHASDCQDQVVGLS